MKIKQTVTQSLAFLGAAISQGQPIKGVEHSPQLLRKTGLFDYLNENYKVKITDYGDIEVLTEQKTKYPPVEFAVKNLNVLGQVLGRIHDQVYNIVQKKQTQFLLTVGGDHSIAAATISGVKRHHKDLRVIWVDAHPDFTNSHMRNPTKMHNQNYHGMPLSHLTGATSIPPLDYWKWITDQPHLDPKNVVLIGIRDIDADEYISLKKYGVKCFTMDHVDMYGIGSVMNQAIEHLDPKNEHPFHLSFDVDGIDPDVVSQTGTRFRYGLSARQAVHIVRRLSHQRRLVSMDLVQINQSLNKNQQIRKKYRGEEMLKDPSETFGLSIDLVASVYTKYLTI